MYKTEDWRPESRDEDFVRHSSNSFLTGISKGPPDEFDIHGLEPTRHGIDNTMIANCSDPVPSASLPECASEVSLTLVAG